MVAFRRRSLLPLDDRPYALRATMPHLTRSSLHGCSKRHGTSRLPKAEADEPERSRFRVYSLGFFHLELAEVHTAEVWLHLFVATDRTTGFAFVELHGKATWVVTVDFLRQLVEEVPTALIDDPAGVTEATLVSTATTWHPAGMTKCDAPTCGKNIDATWRLVSPDEGAPHHPAALKRCPACHGRVMIPGAYGGPNVLRSPSHRRPHGGCPRRGLNRAAGATAVIVASGFMSSTTPLAHEGERP